MARYHRVNIDGKSLFKTETRKLAAATYPGTFAIIDDDDEFAVAAATTGRMYIIDCAYHEGLGIAEQIPAGHTAVGNYLEEGREFAVRIAAGTYAKDQPVYVVNGLATSVPAGAGTYGVIGYIQDDVTTTAVDFIRIRARADSITIE